MITEILIAVIAGVIVVLITPYITSKSIHTKNSLEATHKKTTALLSKAAKKKINLNNLKPLRLIQTYKSEQEKRKYSLLKESTVFFSHRFAEAFPGCRKIEEINDPVKALDRLDILLEAPLFATYENTTAYPVWWWRGTSNLHIQHYRRIKNLATKGTQFLINEVEHHTIKKIIAVHHDSYFRKFVYVEVKGMQPTGLYPYDAHYEEYGEYGWLKNKYVTREDYDDGATIINKKPVDIRKKVKLRSRVLKDYNFLIAPHNSPINNHDADQIIGNILDKILTGEDSIESLSEFIFSLPRRDNTYLD